MPGTSPGGAGSGAPGASGASGVAGSSGGTASGGASGAGAPSTSGSGGTNVSGSGGNDPSGSGGVATGGTSTSGAPGVSGGGGAAAGSGGGGAPSACGATGFHVKEGKLFDVNCEEFVMRGVNYPYTWFATRNYQQDLAAIAATGANTVRLVLSSGGRWTKTSAANLTSLLQAARAAKLVSVVEVHDTTGYSEQTDSVPLTNATSYWTAADIAPVLKGQEAFVIVNVGNEPNGNNTSADWAPSHETAVKALRSAGFEHNLMVDAPNWGQDWEGTMRNGGGVPIWNADPDKNVTFSVHMYDVYGMAATITNYFNTFEMKYDAPLVVGEFAADHGTSGDVDEATIMSFAETLGIGYLGWSWAGNSSDLASLNITNEFNASSLTPWGERLVNGENGIKSTSRPCSCFD